MNSPSFSRLIMPFHSISIAPIVFVPHGNEVAMSPSDRYLIDAFARARAIDLLTALRASKRINKEQLFTDTVIFYRWLIPRLETDDYDRYWNIFAEDHPDLEEKVEPPLRMACFVTWFRSKVCGIEPLSEQEEQEEEE